MYLSVRDPPKDIKFKETSQTYLICTIFANQRRFLAVLSHATYRLSVLASHRSAERIMWLSV